MNRKVSPDYDGHMLPDDDLQQEQISHSLVVKQKLIDTQDELDRDRNRFRVIQSYSRQAIQSEDLEEFARLTAEAIVETFEVECSALLIYDGSEQRLQTR